MKNIYFIVVMTISMNAYSQRKFDFVVKNGKPEIIGDTTNLTLPLVIRFKESDFREKEIIFKNPESKTKISGAERKFGREIKISPQDSGFYQIEFAVNNEDENVQANPLLDFNCPSNSVILEIIGKEFPIHYKTKDVTEKLEGKEIKYVSGYLFYDALALVADTLKPSTKLKILESYEYKGNDHNPYLKELFDVVKKQVNQQSLLTGGSFFTNLGNTDVTYFAAGLARFLAERTKEELNEAFFSKMKEQLNAYPELKTAFPKTASFLDIIETYSYASVIQVLKEAFETDVQNLPENLYNIKGLTDGDCDKISICGEDKVCDNYSDCQSRLKKLAEFFTSQDGKWVALGMFSVKEGIQSTNPAELLKSIVASTEFTNLKTASTSNGKFDDYNIASSIELSNFISQSLISKDDKQIWITTNQLNSLFKTKDAFKIYLGLLLAKELKGDTKVEFYNSSPELVSFGKILADNFSTYTRFESLIKNTYSAYNATNNAVKKMIASSEKSVEAAPQALYDYYRTITASLKPIAHNQLLIKLVGNDIGAAYDKVEQFLNPSVDIAYHIATKKYSAAIYDASILLSALNKFKVTTTDKKGKTTEEKYDGFKTVTKSFVKYGTLISTVANAQSSEEVKQALDASVLPVGSYSIKRKTNWSFSINSYVGTYWSYSNNRDYIPSLGLTAPIGFNISKGFSKSGNCGGLSLNLQILDVGALVNYYLIKGDTASLPNNFNVKLSNVFAPGFNLSYNIPKTPLSIACGGQYIPTLYKYEQINGKNEYTPIKDFRMQLSLLIDIPLFNLKVWDFNK